MLLKSTICCCHAGKQASWKGAACYLPYKRQTMGPGRDSGGGMDGGGVARPTAEGWELTVWDSGKALRIKE